MARDYYEILGIKRDATADEIQRAHRRLVKKHHPDVSKAPDAQERFTEIQEAYDVLSDPKKRSQYDRAGRAGVGAGGPHFSWTNVAGSPGAPGMDPDEIGSVFDAFFGGRGGMGGAERRARPRPRVYRQDLEITFLTAARGGAEQIRVATDSGEKTISVKIPPGAVHESKLRVRLDDPAGEVILTLRVGEHPIFRRVDAPLDLELTLPLSIAEATLGTTLEVPTLDGAVTLTIPPATSGGKKLRLRGRGIRTSDDRAGDLYAVVRVVTPDPSGWDDEQRERIRDLAGPPPRPDDWADTA